MGTLVNYELLKNSTFKRVGMKVVSFNDRVHSRALDSNPGRISAEHTEVSLLFSKLLQTKF
jgi:hypothetical protein